MQWWVVSLACIGLCGAAGSRAGDTPEAPPAPPGPYIASDVPALPESVSLFDPAYPATETPWADSGPGYYFPPVFSPGKYLEQQAAEDLALESQPGYPLYGYPDYQPGYPEFGPQVWWYGAHAPATGWDDPVWLDWPADDPYAMGADAVPGYWQGGPLPPTVEEMAPPDGAGGWLDQDAPPAWAELPPIPLSEPAPRQEPPGSPLPAAGTLIELPSQTLLTTQPERPIPLPGERSKDQGVIGN
jgi:hypothetical protein